MNDLFKKRKDFYFIRHAESLGNIGIDSGYDPDLSPAGYVQAAECSEFMKKHCDSTTVIYSSPFKRTVRTAQAIAKNANTKIILEPALHEFFAVEWYPLNRVKLPSLKQIAATNDNILDMDYPDDQWWPYKNEDSQALTLRLGMLKNHLLSDHVRGKKIVCLGHWASVAGIVNLMCPQIYMEVVYNTGITKIVYDGQRCEPVFINEASFLSRPAKRSKTEFSE